ncbi:hypothetical protein EH227_08070 [Rouxiella chamberiensis]|nr:hypothetical protein EH227_08070 [Rouxiella chamberiensis]
MEPDIALPRPPCFSLSHCLRANSIATAVTLGVVSGGESRFYDITSLQIGKSAGTVAAANIAIGYSESATCDVSNISITVTP